MVPVLGVAVFVFAVVPGGIFDNHWLPEDISQHGKVIDDLFMFILYLGDFYWDGSVVVWFCWKYDAEKNPDPVKFTHGSHTLEIVWSILPAAALLFIAIFKWMQTETRWPTLSKQMGKRKATSALVTGRQFEWLIQYAGPDV